MLPLFAASVSMVSLGVLPLFAVSVSMVSLGVLPSFAVSVLMVSLGIGVLPWLALSAWLGSSSLSAPSVGVGEGFFAFPFALPAGSALALP